MKTKDKVAMLQIATVALIKGKSAMTRSPQNLNKKAQN